MAAWNPEQLESEISVELLAFLVVLYAEYTGARPAIFRGGTDCGDGVDGDSSTAVVVLGVRCCNNRSALQTESSYSTLPLVCALVEANVPGATGDSRSDFCIPPPGGSLQLEGIAVRSPLNGHAATPRNSGLENPF